MYIILFKNFLFYFQPIESRTNPQDCDQFKDECLKGQGGMPSINHHCNAAMAFLVIASKSFCITIKYYIFHQ